MTHKMTLEALKRKFPHLREVGEEVRWRASRQIMSLWSENAWENRGFRVLPDAAPFYYTCTSSAVYHALYTTSQVYAVDSPQAAVKRARFIETELGGNPSLVERIMQQPVAENYARCSDFRTVYRLLAFKDVHWEAKTVDSFTSSQVVYLRWENRHQYELGLPLDEVGEFVAYVDQLGIDEHGLRQCLEVVALTPRKLVMLNKLYVDWKRGRLHD